MKTESSFLRYFKYVFVICLAVVVIMLATGRRAALDPALIAMFASLALYFMSHPVLKSFAFTVWVFAFGAASMVYSGAFMTRFGFDLGILIVPIVAGLIANRILYSRHKTLPASAAVQDRRRLLMHFDWKFSLDDWQEAKKAKFDDSG